MTRRHLAFAAACVAMLAALPTAAGAQALRGAPSYRLPPLLAPGVSLTSETSGGDAINGSFIMIEQTGAMKHPSRSACMSSDSGEVQLKMQHYALNTQVGKMTYDNARQYLPLKSQLEQQAEPARPGPDQLLPARVTPIAGGFLLVQEGIDSSNCNVSRNFTTYSARVASYTVLNGDVVELTVWLQGAASPTAEAMRVHDQTLARIRRTDWSAVRQK